MNENEIQTGTINVPLSRPIDIDGAKVKALTMREPIVDDQLAVQGAGGPVEQEMALIANLCMVKATDLRKMPLRDYYRLKVAYLGFID